MNKPQIINLPKYVDSRGNLSFIEQLNHVPFIIKRTYWLYDVPGGETRGGHAYRDNEEPHVHFWFVPRYKDPIMIFNKEYKDIHFGYNFWKWANDKENDQKDIFTDDERKQIFNMMKEEFNKLNR